MNPVRKIIALLLDGRASRRVADQSIGWNMRAHGRVIAAALAIAVVLGAFAVARRATEAVPGDTVADKLIGYTNFTASNPQCWPLGSPNASNLCSPTGLAFDASGRLWVADAGNNRILAYNAPATNATAQLVVGQGGSFATSTCNQGGSSPTASTLCRPEKLVVDRSGNLFVSDTLNSRVLEYDDPVNTDLIADRVFGQPSFTSSAVNWNGPSATSMWYPGGVALDSNDNLYVADRLNNRVLVYFTPLTSDTIADRVIGQGTATNFTSTAANFGGIGPAGFDQPYALRIDPGDNLWVTELQNARVLEFDQPLSTNFVADRVLGQTNFTNVAQNAGASTPSAFGLYNATGLSFDSAANLYLSETGNERALFFANPITTDMIADQVFGQTGSFTAFGNNNGGVNASTNADAWDTAVDASCNLWIADYGNGRVLEYDLPPGGCVVPPTATPTSTTCPVPVCTATPTPTDTSTPTPTPTFDPCGATFCTPTPTPTCQAPPPCPPTPTPTDTPENTPTPTDTPTPTPTDTPEVPPTETPTPTNTPIDPTNTPTPTATPPLLSTVIAQPVLYLDCNAEAAGAQTNCVAVPGATVTIEIGVFVLAEPESTLGAFEVAIHDPDRSRLAPLSMPGLANPQIAPALGGFGCSPPPVADTGADGPDAAVSWIGCADNAAPGNPDAPVLEPFDLVPLATVSYAVPASATAGTVVLSPGGFMLHDAQLDTSGSCAPAGYPVAQCIEARIQIGCSTDLDCDGYADPAPPSHEGPANSSFAFDNCASIANPSQVNASADFIDLHPAKAYDDRSWPNSDAVGDACDDDDDNDGRSDADEIGGAGGCPATNPLLRDTDGDRILDSVECLYGLNPTVINAPPAACFAVGDADGDGVQDARELCFYGTSPASSNTDGDLCSDAKEIASINANSSVDSIDLGQVAQAFGPYPYGSPAYKYDFDVTKNGTIDSIDLGQVAQRFGPC